MYLEWWQLVLVVVSNLLAGMAAVPLVRRFRYGPPKRLPRGGGALFLISPEELGEEGPEE